MKLKFYGSGKEVGRSCIQLSTEGKNFLLDAGIKMGHAIEHPLMPDLNLIDAVFISHAHLDHTGALPYFNFNGLTAPIFSTMATKDITQLLLQDSYKIALHSGTLDYDENNMHAVMSLFEHRNLRARYEYDHKIRYEFFDAGHIPGSSSILFEAEGKKLLYTGDINTQATRLLNAADTNYGHVDVMICESTYGDKNHEPRIITEKRFINKVNETTHFGSCLIPAFAVGRAQEIMLILSNNDIFVPAYLDGMADAATNTFLRDSQSLRNARELSLSKRKVETVHNFGERKEVEHNKSIIIATSGMLTGGPVIEYLKAMSDKKENSILLTGYQAEETNGRLLLEQHRLQLDNIMKNVKCYVEQFDFSAHAGMQELHEFIKKVNPKKLILNHGDPDAIKSLALFASEQGIEVIVPNNGDELEL